VRVETTLGHFVLELDAERAPMTVCHFVEYARDKFYDGTVFHRVLENSLTQGGGYTPSMDLKTDGLQPGVVNESHNGLLSARGTVALVRVPGKPRASTPQFFINVSDNPSLNSAHGSIDTHTVFGKVVEGMDTVDRIGRTRVGPHPKYAVGRMPVVPSNPVVIKSVGLITPFDPRDAQAVVDAAEAEKRRKAEEARKAKERLIAERIEAIAQQYGKLTTTESGLKYVDIRKGTGPIPTIDDTVELHYRVELLDGTEADNSYEGDPKTSTLQGMKPGVLEGILSMREGGKRFLVVPPELGFGDRGVPKLIPPNAILFYEFELLAIK
jgi:cyclophilin family peptidyl-prolyl cis-trans isomerase